MKVGFFLIGLKGLNTLKSFYESFGNVSIAYVIAAKDSAITNDYYDHIKSFCELHNIFFLDKKQTQTLPNAAYKFAIGWRWIIKDSENLIVLHDSILPKYRGFAPLVNMLINGEKRIGVTALLASDEYDKGDIIDQVSIEIEYPIKVAAAIELLTVLYANIVVNIFRNLHQSSLLTPQKQIDSHSTYSPWLDEKDYFIDWSWSSEKIKRFVDAVGYPYTGAKTRLGSKIVVIHDVTVEEEIFVEGRERHLGKIIFFLNKCPVIICGKGLIALASADTSDCEFVEIPFRSRFE